jgi:hypothetical protein
MAQSKTHDALESFKKSGNSSWRMPIHEILFNSVYSPIYINPVGEMDF